MLSKWFCRIYQTIVFIIFLGLFIHLFAPILVEASPLPNVFINEIHYDNSGADQGEFVELSGVAGLNLAGWSLHFYNGSNGEVYKEHTFTDWLLNDTANGFGFAGVNITGIQNGSPDGIVLADELDNVIQFLSYEGSFTANSGIAAGLLSTDIGVVEPANTPVDFSLQLTGQGSEYMDFSWAVPQESTFGIANFGQSFINNNVDVVPVNEPSAFLLFFIAFLLMITLKVSLKGFLRQASFDKLPSTSSGRTD
ncbi:MAG: lamin tail domain-containing protein [Colwellia sp.]|nr:lamin tail domain-containing protein [Colwellia sp.]MCW9082871.1 lamin tail domain-containing protein [Colwellia sp.]